MKSTLTKLLLLVLSICAAPQAGQSQETADRWRPARGPMISLDKLVVARIRPSANLNVLDLLIPQKEFDWDLLPDEKVVDIVSVFAFQRFEDDDGVVSEKVKIEQKSRLADDIPVKAVVQLSVPVDAIRAFSLSGEEISLKPLAAALEVPKHVFLIETDKIEDAFERMKNLNAYYTAVLRGDSIILFVDSDAIPNSSPVKAWAPHAPTPK